MESDPTFAEKARCKLDDDAMCSFENIQEKVSTSTDVTAISKLSRKTSMKGCQHILAITEKQRPIP